MKLRNKVFAGFAATVTALAMIAGTAFAATNPVFVYGDEAGAKEDAKATVIVEMLAGGGNQDGENGKVYDELQEIAPDAASVDVLLTGNFTGTAHLNFVGDFDFTPDGSGYDNVTYASKDISVDGYLAYSADFGQITADARFAFLLRNKSEGTAVLEAYIIRNADGDVIGGVDGSGFLAATDAEALYDAITSGEATEAPAAEETPTAPKTGVVSTALLLGLGAAVLGTGAVVLKKKED